MIYKIAILAGKGESSRFIYNRLKDKFPIDVIIVEDPPTSSSLIKGRIRKFGVFTVVNQLLFQIFISKLLKLISRKRIDELKTIYNLNSNPIPNGIIHHVSSVNSISCGEILQKVNPDIVIVNGTRIISNKVLSSVHGIFVNIHVGITPKYRGVHGAYWALAEDDLENCGVTVHLVDQGIDTGGVLKQARIHPESHDNFVTYPYHQYASGITLMEEVLEKFVKDKTLDVVDVGGINESKLYYHPKFTTYLYNFFFKGIK